ncbi:MAG TPA: ATP synthase subunit I [Ilumatobacteraceae bacterium]|nr:ATP synthase subunit I [Ilumatobacteraceae bacterium]
MNDIAFSMAAPLPGPSPEVSVSNDMVRRGLMVAPVLIGVCALIWGADGAASSAYAIAIVLVNFALAAGTVAFTAKISLRVMMAAVMFGYLFRLALIFLAVFLVKDAGWISLPALGATIIFTHLGLLVWELKYVAMSLAYPGLKPKASPLSSTVSKPASS